MIKKLSTGSATEECPSRKGKSTRTLPPHLRGHLFRPNFTRWGTSSVRDRSKLFCYTKTKTGPCPRRCGGLRDCSFVLKKLRCLAFFEYSCYATIYANSQEKSGHHDQAPASSERYGISGGSGCDLKSADQ